MAIEQRPALSVRQQDRLRSFRNLTTQVEAQQANLKTGVKSEIKVTTEGGTWTGGVPINQEMVTIWQRTADHMYKGISQNPTMKAEADTIVTQLTTPRKEAEAQDTARRLTETREQLAQFGSFWEKGKDLD